MRLSKTAMATRDAFLTAFWTLYEKNPLDRISIKEITDLAGHNRSTFYTYFDDIQSILEYIEDDVIECMKQHIFCAPLNNTNDAVIARLAKAYDEKGMYLAVLLGENGDPHFIERYKSLFKPALMAAKPFSSLPPTLTTDLLYEFSMSAILNTFNYWYKHRDEMPAGEFIRLQRNILANGAYHVAEKLSRNYRV